MAFCTHRRHRDLRDSLKSAAVARVRSCPPRPLQTLRDVPLRSINVARC
ncbi:unnamed protein product [Ectocarpus sp. CCAP 1310/34]|nr:unnamed protein product [Ectocarpus sp. CCAP 1310/34]